MKRMERLCGALHPVSALGGIGPIGSLDGAKPFIDWLDTAGFRLWQFLPLGPTARNGSPYSSWSALSGNPDLVGIQWCVDAGLLPVGTRLSQTKTVSYSGVLRDKRPLIIEAAAALIEQLDHPWAADFQSFLHTETWAFEAALFYAIGRANGEAAWWAWPDGLRVRDPEALHQVQIDSKTDIVLWQACLFLFERQWSEVRTYARERGILLMGDMPIYVGQDSVDVWAHQELFQLNDLGRPTCVAGVPPDAYSETGQLWENPLFAWDVMAGQGYRWWIERIRRTMVHCDSVRLDHFIGFDRYWAVDADDNNALNGTWQSGPGRSVFDAIRGALGSLPLVAEDLGSVEESTVQLRNDLGLPGMKVLQFGLDGHKGNPHHPANYPKHCVAYSSTHDSPTAMGWWQELGADEKHRSGLSTHGEDACVRMVDMVLESAAAWAIIPMQDLFCLGNDARMNRPGTQHGNWCWRQRCESLRDDLAVQIHQRLQHADRL